MKPRLYAPWLAAACITAITAVAVAQSPAPRRRLPAIWRRAGYAAHPAAAAEARLRARGRRPRGLRRDAGSGRRAAVEPGHAGRRPVQGSRLLQLRGRRKLDPASTPILAHVLRRVAVDTGAVIDPPKDHYGRARPYTAPGATSAPVCVPKSEGLTKNASYPSGHASLSWSWGLILAELAPDRAGEVLARARSIGDSRVVCGVHYLSDIEAGRTTGAALVAALHGDAAFRSDLDQARAELATLRAGAHGPPINCAIQSAAADHPPY